MNYLIILPNLYASVNHDLTRILAYVTILTIFPLTGEAQRKTADR